MGCHPSTTSQPKPEGLVVEDLTSRRSRLRRHSSPSQQSQHDAPSSDRLIHVVFTSETAGSVQHVLPVRRNDTVSAWKGQLLAAFREACEFDPRTLEMEVQLSFADTPIAETESLAEHGIAAEAIVMYRVDTEAVAARIAAEDIQQLEEQEAAAAEALYQARIAEEGEQARLIEEEFAITCHVCGLQDPNFAQEGWLGMHLSQDCPMMGCCTGCGEVMEISHMTDHLLHQCDASHNFSECACCGEATRARDMAIHTSSKQCTPGNEGMNRCPLCHGCFAAGNDAWRRHLIVQCCPDNPRTKFSDVVQHQRALPKLFDFVN